MDIEWINFIHSAFHIQNAPHGRLYRANHISENQGRKRVKIFGALRAPFCLLISPKVLKMAATPPKLLHVHINEIEGGFAAQIVLHISEIVTSAVKFQLLHISESYI